MTKFQEYYDELSKYGGVSLYCVVEAFVEEVDKRVIEKMQITAQLEGTHYAAMQEVLEELRDYEGSSI